MKIPYIGYSILQVHLNKTFDPKCSLWTSWASFYRVYYVTKSKKIYICELIKQI